MATIRDKIPTTYKGLKEELDRRVNAGVFDEKRVVEHMHSLFRTYEEEKPYLRPVSYSHTRVCEGVRLTEELMAQTMIFNGQLLKRHVNGGGFVRADQDSSDSTKPFVEDSVYVGPFAMVYDNARIRGNVHISEFARVFGNAKISGNVRLAGHAWVCGDSRITGIDIFISDNVKIFDAPWLTGVMRITGDAWISGNANIIGDGKLDYRLKGVLFKPGNSLIQAMQNERVEMKVSVLWICDGVWIFEHAQISGISYIRGSTKIRGNYKARGGEYFAGTFE